MLKHTSYSQDCYKTEWKKTLDENQPREQAGFRKGYSTTDHLHALNQTIEKSKEYHRPLCLGFIDYEKAFDSVEHFAIFQALRKINVNETYVKILENIYRNASAKIHLDNHISDSFNINRGVRQGDPISPKLFTAAIEEIFKTVYIDNDKDEKKYGINIEGEYLTDLRFADDVALCTETEEDMESQLNKLNTESNKIGLKIHRGKTKFMTNYESDKEVQIENQKIEKVKNYKYLGQNTVFENKTKEEIAIRIRNAWFAFGKYRDIFQDKNLPMTLKKKVFNQSILPIMTYGCQTWSLTKELSSKLQTTQRSMERKMLGIKLQDKVPCTTIRQKTGVTDVLKYALTQKWNWAGHIARYTDNRWTKRCTDWRPRNGFRTAGRPTRRWRDDIGNMRASHDTEKHKRERNDDYLWRATFNSGWTTPK